MVSYIFVCVYSVIPLDTINLAPVDLTVSETNKTCLVCFNTCHSNTKTWHFYIPTVILTERDLIQTEFNQEVIMESAISRFVLLSFAIHNPSSHCKNGKQENQK